MLFPKLANNAPLAVNPDGTLTFKEKFSYGLGDFACQLLLGPAGGLLIYYYSEYVGIDISDIGMILLLSRLLDGIIDIMIGVMVDRTRSPYGRQRVWLMRMAIPFMIALILLYSVPLDWDYGWKLVYVFISYNIAIPVIYTCTNLPYGSLASSITQNYDERAKLSIYRMLLAAVGGSFAGAATLYIVEFLQDTFFDGQRTPLAWVITMTLYGVIAVILFYFVVANTRERTNCRNGEDTEAVPDKKDILIGVSELFKNRYWVFLTMGCLALCAAEAAAGAAGTYYSQYFLGDPKIIGVYSLYGTVVRLLMLFFIAPIIMVRWGKRNSVLFGIAFVLLSFALRLFFPYSHEMNLVITLINGVGQAFTWTGIFAMIPDTVEYGEFRFHVRREGLSFAGASFAMKMASGIGPAATTFFVSSTGYVNGAAVQNAQTMDAILYSATLIPALFYLVCIGSLLAYRLDKEYPAILKALALRYSEKELVEAQ